MRPHALLISVVDNDASIRQALAGLFRSVGSPVATFATAEEFLRSDRPGATACAAHGDEEAPMWASRSGVVRFLRMPFDTEALRSSVEAALRDCEQEEVVKHARAAD
jgi:FixJ family two-component response regulator